jgi:hypothetical protein
MRLTGVASIVLGDVNSIVFQQGNRFLTEKKQLPTEPSPELINRAWFNENLVSRW